MLADLQAEGETRDTERDTILSPNDFSLVFIGVISVAQLNWTNMVLLHAVRQLISHKKLEHRKDKDIFEVQSFCNCRYLGRNAWTSPQSFILKMCLLH